jgi:hypothetical protein
LTEEVLKLPEPMQMGPAIETMKILRHYSVSIRQETDPMTLVLILVREIQERQPSDLVRLASLMHRISPDEVMEKVKGADDQASTFYRILVEGFIANPLPDLINTGYMIGIIEQGWSDI